MVARKRRRAVCIQRTLESYLHGGFRPGAGRKKQPGSGVSHDTREDFHERIPVHVTLKLRGGLRSLRKNREFRRLCRCLAKGKEKPGFRLIHFSVQSNHIHLIVEAKGKICLARGIQGLKVRMAKALNKLWSRSGSVFFGRYHAELLKTPRQVRNALRYVLENARKHAVRLAPGELDPCSSAVLFDGWSHTPRECSGLSLPDLVVRARSWLLNIGWRRRGLLALQLVGREHPRPRAARSWV